VCDADGQGKEDGEAVDGQATLVADSLMALARKLGANEQKGVCEKFVFLV
jgi:hypothetical protein